MLKTRPNVFVNNAACVYTYYTDINMANLNALTQGNSKSEIICLTFNGLRNNSGITSILFSVCVTICAFRKHGMAVTDFL